MIQAEEAAMRHYVHSIGLALLVKLKPKHLERAADRYPVHANPMNRILASILLMDVEQSTEFLVRWGDVACETCSINSTGLPIVTSRSFAAAASI